MANKYAAKTPEARQRQLANLTPQGAVKHGAYSADLLKPERERVLEALLGAGAEPPIWRVTPEPS